MRKLITGIAASAAFFGLVGTAGAVPPVFNPPPIPAYCHGFDVSYTIATFAPNGGGVPAVIAGSGMTVQQAQQADKVYCRTGVLP